MPGYHSLGPYPLSHPVYGNQWSAELVWAGNQMIGIDSIPARACINRPADWQNMLFCQPFQLYHPLINKNIVG